MAENILFENCNTGALEMFPFGFYLLGECFTFDIGFCMVVSGACECVLAKAKLLHDQFVTRMESDSASFRFVAN